MPISTMNSDAIKVRPNRVRAWLPFLLIAPSVILLFSLIAYRRRSHVESKLNCSKLLGQSLVARDFDRRVAELQIRITVLTNYTALGVFIKEAVGYVCPGKGEGFGKSTDENQRLETVELAPWSHRQFGPSARNCLKQNVLKTFGGN